MLGNSIRILSKELYVLCKYMVVYIGKENIKGSLYDIGMVA